MINEQQREVTWSKTWRPYYLAIVPFIIGSLIYLLVFSRSKFINNIEELNKEKYNYDVDYFLKNPRVSDTNYSLIEFNENSYNCEEVFCSVFIKQTNETTFNETSGENCKKKFGVCYNPNIKVSYSVIFDNNKIILEHEWNEYCGLNYKCVIDLINRYIAEGYNKSVNGVYQIKDVYNLIPKREHNHEPYNNRFIELIDNKIYTTDTDSFIVIVVICIAISMFIMASMVACILLDEQIRRIQEEERAAREEI